MKKFICLLLSLCTVFLFTACGGSGQGGNSGKAWTREGIFTDENQNFLSITAYEDGDTDGWYVGCMLGNESYGNLIPQEGDTLHGDMIPEGEEGSFVITISEEGEDGVQLVVDGGDTYHFVPDEEETGSITLTVNTDGDGQIAYAKEGEELKFDDDAPAQSAQVNLNEPATYVLGAKAAENWKFVKWTKDGEDFSTEEQITVEIDATTEYVAVFDVVEVE